jgi:hypothetical protein
VLVERRREPRKLPCGLILFAFGTPASRHPTSSGDRATDHLSMALCKAGCGFYGNSDRYEGFCSSCFKKRNGGASEEELQRDIMVANQEAMKDAVAKEWASYDRMLSSWNEGFRFHCDDCGARTKKTRHLTPAGLPCAGCRMIKLPGVDDSEDELRRKISYVLQTKCQMGVSEAFAEANEIVDKGLEERRRALPTSAPVAPPPLAPPPKVAPNVAPPQPNGPPPAATVDTSAFGDEDFERMLCTREQFLSLLPWKQRQLVAHCARGAPARAEASIDDAEDFRRSDLSMLP